MSDRLEAALREELNDRRALAAMARRMDLQRARLSQLKLALAARRLLRAR